MKTKLCTIKVHSIVDLITNSSTELFCVIKADSLKAVEKVIKEILDECGCVILSNRSDDGLTVEQRTNWNNVTQHEDIIKGEFAIYYEQHAPPCKLVLRKLKEVFEITEEGDI